MFWESAHFAVILENVSMVINIDEICIVSSCLYSEIDRDGDGRVSYRDFEYMMSYSTEDAL